MTKPIVDADAIPAELQERDQWLLWDSSNDTPKQPHWRGDFAISWSNPDDWHSFEAALSAAQERDSWGIGYVMAQDNDAHARGLYACLDLDGCLESRTTPKDWLPSLQAFIDAGAYIEYSPSGNGLHIPLVGQDIPEWWRDSHLTDAGHEGVDVLENKFCTFTGDVLEDLEPTGVADISPAPFLNECYEALNGEYPGENKSSRDSGDSGGEWSQEQIKEALSHLDSACSYPQWRDLAFAVHDWDASTTGQQLFEQWSRGSGWDEQSQRYIEKIWDGAAQGDGITVGTLIHLAQEAGWHPSGSKPSLDAAHDDAESEQAAAEADGGATTDQAAASPVSSLESDVTAAIAAADADEIQLKTARHRIATAFVTHHDFVYPEEEVRGWRCTLYVFDGDEGVYEPRGERFVSKRLEQLCGDFITNQTRNEIVEKIKRMSSGRGAAFETSPQRLVVGNGILDLHTGELDAYTATEYHRTKIDVDWNPDAGEPDAIDEFLHDIVKPGDVATLYRLIAHGLYKEYVTEKAAMLIGSGQNGKSVFLDFVEQFLHAENVTHRSLQDFDENDFAANQLAGKLANVHPDMGDGKVRDLSMFKKLTGRDTMLADVKYEKPIQFENYATMIFAANEMPVFAEDNHAVWRRWLYIDFPNTFDANDPEAHDPEPKRVLMDRLTDDEQLEALLVKCQREIQEWHAGGREWFADAMDPEAVREKMKKAAEPVYNFASSCLEAADGEYVDKATVRDCYRRYAEEEDLSKLTDNKFGEELLSLRDYQIETERKRENGSRVQVYAGVTLSSRGRQIMGLDEIDDENQSGMGDGWDSYKPVVMEELREMFEANEHEPVPRNGLVWRVASDMGKATAEKTVDDLLEVGEIMTHGANLISPTES